LSPKTAALVRWTGRGRVERLRSSIEYVLRCNRLRGRVWRIGNTVVIQGPDPVRVGMTLAHLPGVAWVGAGLQFSSMKEAAGTAGLIAKKYLRQGAKFWVVGEGPGGSAGSDVGGAATSGVLDAVKGARVSESAGVRFRAAWDGRNGVVGVELERGPGGASRGDRWASCLVSGGAHSSVVAWHALLAGLRVRLVHVKTTEQSLMAVAGLYAELSHRVDPRALKLVVVEGGTTKWLAAHLAGEGEETYGGFTPTSQPAPRALSRTVGAPLYLLPEEEFAVQFAALGVRADEAEPRWDKQPRGEPRLRKFEGWAEDVSAVLDGLR
jgi:adenylyl- and sulfurtransferase ThiI